MFAATAVLMVLTSPVGEVVETTRSLELKLDVIEAFEHGPVILDVTLTNRGKRTLAADCGYPANNSTITPPATWKAWEPSLGTGGWFMVRYQTIEPGQSLTERHTLHREYLSTFPPGKSEVTVAWTLCSRAKPGEDVRVLAIVAKKFPVIITPATPANRAALARRLKAELAALPPGTSWNVGDPLYTLCRKLSNTPHKELLPIALEMMERAGDNSEGFDLREWMTEVVYRIDPAAAHRMFVDRLLTNPPRASATEVFDLWRRAADDFQDPAQRYFERLYEQPRAEMYPNPEYYWFRPDYWEQLWPGEEVRAFLLWAGFSAPRILPAGELKRLATAKDFTVRAYTYSAFGHRLGQAWCDEFLKEAGRYARAKPDPKITDPEKSPLYTLVKDSDPDKPRERKFLDVFAAGAEANPLTKLARDKVTEYEKQKQERKQ